MADGSHVPVLLKEAVAALAIKPEGLYVDASFGRGGHSRATRAPDREESSEDHGDQRPQAGGQLLLASR